DHADPVTATPCGEVAHRPQAGIGVGVHVGRNAGDAERPGKPLATRDESHRQPRAREALGYLEIARRRAAPPRRAGEQENRARALHPMTSPPQIRFRRLAIVGAWAPHRTEDAIARAARRL